MARIRVTRLGSLRHPRHIRPSYQLWKVVLIVPSAGGVEFASSLRRIPLPHPTADGLSSKVGAYGDADINRDHTRWGHVPPRVAFKTRHKPTTQIVCSYNMFKFYPHLNNIQPPGMTVSVRLQSLYGTYSNRPKSQEGSQNSGWSYCMVPDDMVSHGQPTQRKCAHRETR